ncbi:response regulator [Chitinophaga oryziterrae]|uniref:Response regulator n=1 Tax=Chitinophaga oryziterrae TaxID=1031224 RepID=A0A6N8J3H6_9BACT|nr:LytTR family DNA-binding domain-containing protein [Chitinophaga oryziterrae]MVT39573.1 response regulator [Chitinophaga oryziterrae]
MKILIIEDEKHNAARLQRILLEIDARIDVVGLLETMKDSITWFKNNPAPDVALMDVRLSDGLSFDIFSEVTVKCPIIFTTAYDEYAVRAFKVNSIDYLLKPIEKNELITALGKVKVNNNIPQYINVNQLSELLNQRTLMFRKRFLLPSYDGYKTLLTEEIEFIYSEFKTTHVVLKDGRVEILPQSMEELEEELDPDVFFRANRQLIVHINSIGSIQNSFNGKLKIILKKNKTREVIVSREKAPLLKAWLDR